MCEDIKEVLEVLDTLGNMSCQNDNDGESGRSMIDDLMDLI